MTYEKQRSKMSLNQIKFMLFFHLTMLPWGGFSQEWNWSWAKQMHGANNYLCEVTSVDLKNRYYLKVTYEDTLKIGDTLFAHPFYPPRVLTAIGIFDHNGSFIRALDLFSDTYLFSRTEALNAGPDLSMLIAGTFSDDFHLSDTLLHAGQKPEAFLGIFDDHGEREWVGTIRAPQQINIYGFYPLPDGTSVLVGEHEAYSTPLWINFMGADSLQHVNALIFVMRLDRDGRILWRKDCLCVNRWGASVRNTFAGKDGLIYVHGETKCSLAVGADTLHCPDSLNRNFIIGLDTAGNLVYRQLQIWDAGLMSMEQDSEGNFIFGGIVADTLCFANDTVTVPVNHFPCILGRMDRENNLLWYHTYEPDWYPYYHWIHFATDQDTIFASLVFEQKITIGDSTYHANGRRTLIMEYSLDGVFHDAFLMRGGSTLYSWQVIPDRCSDIAVGAIFRTITILGSDTLVPDSLYEGMVGRINRWHHPFDMGQDTSGCGSLTLHAPAYWRFFDWNHGAGEDSIFTVENTGWVYLSVSDSSYCWRDDSVFVTVRPFPEVFLGADTSLLMSDTLRLEAPPGCDSYRWSGGQSDQVIYLTGAGLGEGAHQVWVQVTKDGCDGADTLVITVAGVGTGDEPKTPRVLVYPNPSEGLITIRTAEGDQICSVQITDLAGREVFYGKAFCSDLLDLRFLPKGIYIIRIVSGRSASAHMIEIIP
jgi:hypothetical protein